MHGRGGLTQATWRASLTYCSLVYGLKIVIQPHCCGWWHRIVLTSLLLGPTAMCVTAMGADAQLSPTPDVDARRLPPGGASVLRVDGLLDETAWRDAPMASGFRQREPFEGEPATEITEVRVLFDDATLYVGVLARDRSPDDVIARILQRDKLMETGFEPIPGFTSDDAVVIVLDPFHDHRNAVVLGTNPNSAEFDALITDEGREFNIDWRGVWEVAARRTPEGWSAEFAIPFRSLRFPQASDEPSHNTVDVPAGEFTADLARFQVGYAVSTTLVANALVQYNKRDDELSVSVRINFIHRPGSDLFIVFNEERGSATSIWDVNTRAAVVKLTYLARL